MGNLLVQERTVVVPGEKIAEGLDYLPANGAYRKDDFILAGRLGLLTVDGRAVKIIPLSGRYMPKRNDIIIGKVIDVTISGWRFEINCAYSAMLSMKDATSDFIQRGADLRQFFDLGDMVVAKIVNVTSQKLVDLTTKGPGLRKLYGGRIVYVNCNKVPRVIGKQGSMVSLIKNATGCKIIVGQNGVIWIDGEPKNEVIAIEAIRKIEEESHTSGLTDRMTEYLESKCGKFKQEQEEQPQEEQ
jgi:exosome complex component RRP4